jgi:O-antigen ligase
MNGEKRASSANNFRTQNKRWHYAISILGGVVYALLIVNLYSKYEPYKAIIVVAVIAVLSLSLCAKHIGRFFLILLVFFLPFNASLLKQHLGPSADLFLSLVDLPLLVLAGLWVADLAAARNSAHQSSRMVLPAVCLIVWSGLSILNAVNVPVSVVEMIRLTKVYLLFICVAYHVRTTKDVRWVVFVLLLGVVLQFSLSFGQVVFGPSQVVRKLGGLVETYQSSYGSEETTNVIRFSGTIGHPNGFGAYLLFLVPLSISLSLSQIRPIHKFLCHAVSAVGIIALIYSFSRAAWVGFLVSIFVLAYVGQRTTGKNRILNMVAMLLILFLVVGSFYGMVAARVSGGDRGSAQSRFAKWQGASAVVAAHPILGVGVNNFGLVVNRYFPYFEPTEDSVEKDPHNGYLRIAAEIGVVGLFFFMWFIIAFFKEALACLKANDDFLFSVAVGILAGFSGFLADILFGPQYYENVGRLFFWFMAGLLVALRQIVSDRQRVAQLE